MLRLTDGFYYFCACVCLGREGGGVVAVSKQGQWCTVCESGGNNTHHSFRGFERGICKTAVLGQDCTGSAQKQEGQWSQSERMKEVTNDCRGWDGKKERIRQPQVWRRSRCLVQDNGDIFFWFLFLNNKKLLLHKSEGLFFESGVSLVLKGPSYSTSYVHISIL